MKNFHTLGTVAFALFGVTGVVILWFYFSESADPHDYLNARFALRVWMAVAAVFWTWYFREERKLANPTHFTEKTAFVDHLELQASFDEAASVAATWLAPGKTPTAVLALDAVGFNARLRRLETAIPAEAGESSAGQIRIGVQLLVPKTALASLRVGTTPRVLIDGGPIGVGQVVRTAPA